MVTEEFERVRDAVMAQVAELLSALAPLGVATIRDRYVADEVKAGLRGVEFLDHGGQPIPVGSRPFGAALPAIYLGREGQIVLRDFNGDADMNRAAEQVLNNLIALLCEQDPLLINRIDVEIPVTNGADMQVIISRDGEPLPSAWQVQADGNPFSPSP